MRGKKLFVQVCVWRGMNDTGGPWCGSLNLSLSLFLFVFVFLMTSADGDLVSFTFYFTLFTLCSCPFCPVLFDLYP